MEKFNIKLQVLLAFESSFCSRQLCALKSSASHQISRLEKLKEACWNGWFHSIFPEIFGEELHRTLFISGVTEGQTTIEVKLAKSLEIIDEETSIKPGDFYNHLIFN